MKSILCYGDSNTWGAKPRKDPNDDERFERKDRWPGILKRNLGVNFLVIEEGLRGRTTVFDDPIEGDHKNGYSYLLPCLESHYPLDLVIFFLGTNDLKKRFSNSENEIALGLLRLIKLVKSSQFGRNKTSPHILIISPPEITKLSTYLEVFENALTKSKNLGLYFSKIATNNNCFFFDAKCIVEPSMIDGIHLNKNDHKVLGEKLSKFILENIFGNDH